MTSIARGTIVIRPVTERELHVTHRVWLRNIARAMRRLIARLRACAITDASGR